MTKRKYTGKWGLRVNGTIGPNGGIYKSWYAAKESLYKRALYIQHNAERNNHPRKDEIGVRALHAEMVLAAKRVPRQPLRIDLWMLDHPDKPIRFSIGREPY